ncbi:uncharacterized protein BJX67DRAFT_341071 [Aspergillus lucknowensis]|uniref:Ribonucleotide reductase inhibitor-domain-containing protein n=1 Tax=Aspergillus lucknowensis TaxID=176173 RepID=A0ABR4M5R6_9EURO
MTGTTKPDLSSKRRRFQPPITTFFTTSPNPSSNDSSSVSYNHYSAVTHSPTPVVPAKVQASLLSVGMRVRKSVAEGYKTHHAKAIDEKYTTTTFASDEKVNTLKRTHMLSTTRSELAPFSGMGKPTEYTPSLPYPTTSTSTHHNFNHIITTDEPDDAFSLPPSSQESIDSQSFTPPITKKRAHSDFDPYEDDLDFEGIVNNWQDPLRLNPVNQGRTILSPTLNHQRRRFIGETQKAIGVCTMDLDDFEEATFLRRREEVDMDVEFQMSGA